MSGVRSSWLMRERNSDLARLAWSAVIKARLRWVTSDQITTVPPSRVRRSVARRPAAVGQAISVRAAGLLVSAQALAEPGLQVFRRLGVEPLLRHAADKLREAHAERAMLTGKGEKLGEAQVIQTDPSSASNRAKAYVHGYDCIDQAQAQALDALLVGLPCADVAKRDKRHPDRRGGGRPSIRRRNPAASLPAQRSKAPGLHFCRSPRSRQAQIGHPSLSARMTGWWACPARRWPGPRAVGQRQG